MKTVNTCAYATSFAEKSDTDSGSFITTLFGFPVCDCYPKSIWVFKIDHLFNNKCYKVKKVKSSMARSLQWRIYYHRMWGQLSTTCSNVLKQPNGELLVAVNHIQLQTMASESIDSIDWSHPLPSWAVPPERLACIQCNLSGNRTCNRSMRGNHLAYAATQGMKFDRSDHMISYHIIIMHGGRAVQRQHGPITNMS